MTLKKVVHTYVEERKFGKAASEIIKDLAQYATTFHQEAFFFLEYSHLSLVVSL